MDTFTANFPTAKGISTLERRQIPTFGNTDNEIVVSVI